MLTNAGRERERGLGEGGGLKSGVGLGCEGGIITYIRENIVGLFVLIRNFSYGRVISSSSSSSSSCVCVCVFVCVKDGMKCFI